ncbi:hypothetical protein L249_8744 [Ophiocordyceps polyrhachis-furcata BCC 54312]|uniref:Uncharacterized protein n=1 Tax=Ophiocordyceps polyrhachis-furcata BCC 54312 TaxID=1330021 RepID=A0A367L6I6_9HYPO|nr:hypothetical protein L249_8744 [Ophiocordyceps polyrhachis-furcata BCC 54312]
MLPKAVLISSLAGFSMAQFDQVVSKVDSIFSAAESAVDNKASDIVSKIESKTSIISEILSDKTAAASSAPAPASSASSAPAANPTTTTNEPVSTGMKAGSYDQPTPAPGPVTVTTTRVVHDEYVTWCPEPTVVTMNGKFYTADKPMHITIKDCPCTIVEPVPGGGSGCSGPECGGGGGGGKGGCSGPECGGGKGGPGNGCSGPECGGGNGKGGPEGGKPGCSGPECGGEGGAEGGKPGGCSGPECAGGPEGGKPGAEGGKPGAEGGKPGEKEACSGPSCPKGPEAGKPGAEGGKGGDKGACSGPSCPAGSGNGYNNYEKTVEVASAHAKSIAYALAMAAAGVVSYLALITGRTQHYRHTLGDQGYSLYREQLQLSPAITRPAPAIGPTPGFPTPAATATRPHTEPQSPSRRHYLRKRLLVVPRESITTSGADPSWRSLPSFDPLAATTPAKVKGLSRSCVSEQIPIKMHMDSAMERIKGQVVHQQQFAMEILLCHAPAVEKGARDIDESVRIRLPH